MRCDNSCVLAMYHKRTSLQLHTLSPGHRRPEETAIATNYQRFTICACPRLRSAGAVVYTSSSCAERAINTSCRICHATDVSQERLAGSKRGGEARTCSKPLTTRLHDIDIYFQVFIKI